MNLVIIDYGAGNVRSVQFALERLGYEATCTNDVEKIRKADKVIFPGVGEASSAMQELTRYGLDALIPQFDLPVGGELSDLDERSLDRVPADAHFVFAASVVADRRQHGW